MRTTTNKPRTNDTRKASRGAEKFLTKQPETAYFVSMSCHDTKTCARCNSSFECKPANIAQCQCYGISFEEDEKTFIAGAYSDCLCRNCLLELKQQLKQQPREEAIKKMHSFFRSR